MCARDSFIWSPPWNSARDLVVHQVSAVGNEEPSIQETLVPWVALEQKLEQKLEVFPSKMKI